METSTAPTATIVHHPSEQKRATALVFTDTSELQETTEGECSPFFVDLTTLSKNSLDHLRDTGLLPARQATSDAVASVDNNDHEDQDFGVCLLRDKHYSYLSRVFLPSEQPLGRNLVSLDASRPWMMYWTLHGCDLLMTEDNKKNDTTKADDNGVNLLCQAAGDSALCAVVSTLEACWQTIENIALPQHMDLTDEEISLLDPSTNRTSYRGGGFGGGPGQMAHAATSYAAVLALCIVATSSCGAVSSKMAWDLLERIRKPMYAWLLSLQQPHGGFRMHHDGEIDVRASYTVFCIAKLLNILTLSLASPLTVKYIASCQTYEGGFGGEPFTEAHGGYAYCAVAALQLVDRLDDSSIDMNALRGWLLRRQMGYEGGFSGRANKLVDGCYSFWQGGALAIVSAHYTEAYETQSNLASANRGDIWLSATVSNNETQGNNLSNQRSPMSYAMLFDKPMLQRYILLCAQDVSGGLRDKPSKPRDFYHSCYNLSGLALSQHSGSTSSSTRGEDSQHANFGHPTQSKVAVSHPCYNIRLSRVEAVLQHFSSVR